MRDNSEYYRTRAIEITQEIVEMKDAGVCESKIRVKMFIQEYCLRKCGELEQVKFVVRMTMGSKMP